MKTTWRCEMVGGNVIGEGMDTEVEKAQRMDCCREYVDHPQFGLLPVEAPLVELEGLLYELLGEPDETGSIEWACRGNIAGNSSCTISPWSTTVSHWPEMVSLTPAAEALLAGRRGSARRGAEGQRRHRRRAEGPPVREIEERREAMFEQIMSPPLRCVNSWQYAVQLFHRALGQSVGNPTKPRLVDHELRCKLIAEEAGEMIDAIRADDLIEAIDGAVDLIYVVLGAMVSAGVDVESFFWEVHRSNMEKAGGPRREDGKILKPEGWKAPDIAGLLERHTSALCRVR